MDLRGPTGQYLLRPLFWETASVESRKSFTPLYTFKENDHTDEEGNVYKSIYHIYMSFDTEYEAAMHLIGSMYHWDKLCGTKWFMDGPIVSGGNRGTYMGLNDWRRHKQLEQETASYHKIKAEAESGNFQAMKYLHQREVASSKAKRGPKAHATKNTADDELTDNIKLFAATREVK